MLFSIVISGFIFRFKGIAGNHSFWADEAYVAGLSRDILTGYRTPSDAIKLLNYQPLYLLTTALSMSIFGLNEFGARISSIIFGTLGIIAAYLLAKQLSNVFGGLLGAFLYAISQLNLAHHTQAKSATAIQTILLINIYLLTRLNIKRKNLHIHILIIVLSLASTLFHILGLLVWIPYLVYLWQTTNFRRFKVLLLIIAIGVFFLSSGPSIAYEFLKANGLTVLLSIDNITYLRELLWKNYGLVFLPAFMGIIISFKHHRQLMIALSIWILALLYLWTRSFHFRYLRYLLPFIGLLFVFFGVFWSKVGEHMLNKKSWLICLIIAVLVYMGGDKFVRKPADYYNPNKDIYGDVQIADYKTFYRLMGEKYPDLSNIAVFNNLYDVQQWYLPQKSADAYFSIGVKKPYPNRADGKMVYGALSDFLRIKNQYPTGILIVEDWISLLPEDIRNYAKNNLKLEMKVDNLPGAKDDPWPLKVYSWGL